MKLLLFFNGWAMDENILENLKNDTSYEFRLLNFPYDVDMEELKKAEEIIFVAWSFGVFYLCKFLSENKEIKEFEENKKIKKVISINGLAETIGRNGISEKMFDFTLNTLSEESLLDFYKNMGINSSFKKPSISFKAAKKELASFKDNFKENYENVENKIDFAYIGSFDKIIAARKQENYYKKNNVDYEIREFPHYPFYELNYLSKIIGEKAVRAK